MPDLLLTHGYYLYEDPKEMQIMKPYAPLGILYLCSHLRQQGFNVEVFDTTFSSSAISLPSPANREAVHTWHLRQPDDSLECSGDYPRGPGSRLACDRRWA